MAVTTHHDGREINMVLLSQIFQGASKMHLWLRLRIRSVATEEKKAATFHRRLLEDMRRKWPEATLNKIERLEMLQNERIMACEQHRDGVPAVGKATQGAPLWRGIRHHIEKALEHQPVGMARSLVILHRDQGTVILLVRTLEQGEGYTNEIARDDHPGGYRQTIASAAFVPVEENENRKLAVPSIIGGQCGRQAGGLPLTAGECFQRVR